MNTRNLNALDQSLLNSEFELARVIYDQARGQGHGPLKAAALVYRHGFLDGREKERARADAAHKRLHEFKAQLESGNSQPEATNEGSDNNE